MRTRYMALVYGACIIKFETLYIIQCSCRQTTINYRVIVRRVASSPYTCRPYASALIIIREFCHYTRTWINCACVVRKYIARAPRKCIADASMARNLIRNVYYYQEVTFQKTVCGLSGPEEQSV